MEQKTYILKDKRVLRFSFEPVKNEKLSTKHHEVMDMALVALVSAPGSREVASHLLELRRNDGSVIEYNEGVEPYLDTNDNDVVEIFKSQVQAPQGGTPLDQSGFLNAAQIVALKAANIYTIEQLSDLPDGLLNNIGLGGFDLRRMAKNWVQQHVNDDRDEKFNELQQEIEELKSQLFAAQEGGHTLEAAKKPKKRGRPPRYKGSMFTPSEAA